MQLASRRTRSLVNLTPLIDVVFILLIFFMLASNFLKWQQIDMGLEQAEDIVLNDQKVSVVAIKLNDVLTLNGQEMGLDKILNAVKTKLTQSAGHAVVVQPDETVSLQAMLNVFEPLQEIAGDQVSLAADHPSSVHETL